MLGGDLAIIRSAAENAFIFKLVIKQSTVQNWGVWLGFVRKADNTFYWIDGTAMANGYTAWGRGEPNNVKEKCGNMFGKEGRAGKWNFTLLCCSRQPEVYPSYTLQEKCKLSEKLAKQIKKAKCQPKKKKSNRFDAPF